MMDSHYRSGITSFLELTLLQIHWLSCCSLSTEECFHLRALAHAAAFAQNVPQMSTQLVPSFPFKNVFTESIHSNHCINKKVPYREILSPLPLLHSLS